MDEHQERVLIACNHILDLAPEGQVDDYARNNLKSDLSKFESSKHPKIARVEFAVDKCKSDNLIGSVADLESPSEIGMSFTGMSLEPVWEYNTPTRRLKTDRSGKGGILYFETKRGRAGMSWDPMGGITTEKAMVYVYTTRWFFPERLKDVSERPADTPLPKPSGLLSFFDWWEDVRTKNYIPFEIAACAYTKTRRFMYTIDLVNNTILMDFRQGVFSRKRLSREPLDFLYVDRTLASNELKEIQKKVLMYAFEVEGVSASEIAFGFRITETMARNHLMGIVDREIMRTRGEGMSATYYVDVDRLRETRGDVFG